MLKLGILTFLFVYVGLARAEEIQKPADKLQQLLGSHSSVGKCAIEVQAPTEKTAFIKVQKIVEKVIRKESGRGNPLHLSPA